MPNAYDIAYALGLGAASPFWLVKSSARRKVFKAFRERMGRGTGIDDAPRDATGPAVMIHAVSLGEMNATRSLVRGLAERDPALRFIVSATTDTGFARGRELYGADPKVTVIRYPLDFSGAIRRVLAALRPCVVVLMELEVWPNFVRECERAGVPVVLVNGRLTGSSFRNYRRGRALVRPMFRRLAAVCAQEEAYAERFIELGVPPARVSVTGTMKFDTADVADRIEGDRALADALDLRPNEQLWVCGSTGPGEEEIVLRVYGRLLATHPTLHLAIIPRHPQRFDEVATLIEQSGFPLIRRSVSVKSAIRNPKSEMIPVLLGDTMGELRKFYSLATIVFVGRTLVDLGPRQHGSDMIEPAALAKPVIVGPHTGNFADVMSRFRAAGAMREVAGEDDLFAAMSELLASPAAAADLGAKAQDVVRAGKGATARHIATIVAHLERREGPSTSPPAA